MRSTPRAALRAAVLLLATAAAACASAPAEGPAEAAGGTSETSTIIVQNNHTDGRDLLIYVEPLGRGERRTLGTVAAGQTSSFEHMLDSGPYRLQGGHNLGEVNSDQFTVTGPSEVRWTLNPNRVTVRRKR